MSAPPKLPRTLWSIPGRRRAPLTRVLRSRGAPRSPGQALVELALIVPVLFLLLLGAVDLGRVFYALITITNSAREAAMLASQMPTSFQAGVACSLSNQVMCAATREPQNSIVTIAPADVVLTCSPSCASNYGTTVTVTVTGRFDPLTPIIKGIVGGEFLTFQSASTAEVVKLPTTGASSPTPTPSPSPTPTPAPSPTPSPTPVGSPTPTPSPTPGPTPTPTPTPCAPPVAGFTYSQADKNAPVVFVSTSTSTSGPCAIGYWRWEYGDGEINAGNLSTATHDYGNKNRGKWFLVTLSVTNPGGTVSHWILVLTKS